MHPIKKSAETLRSYLGRDKQGIELLDSLVRIANDLRKQLATAKATAESAASLQSRSDTSLESAKREVVVLKRDIRQEQVRNEQSNRDLQSQQNTIDDLQKQIDREYGPEDTSSGIATEGIASPQSALCAVNSLRRWKRLCPLPLRGVEPKKNHDEHLMYSVYELSDVMVKFSGNEYSNLGRFVSTMAILNFPCIIESSSTLKDFCTEDERENIARLFYRWFRKNVDCQSRAKMGDFSVDMSSLDLKEDILDSSL